MDLFKITKTDWEANIELLKRSIELSNTMKLIFDYPVFLKFNNLEPMDEVGTLIVNNEEYQLFNFNVEGLQLNNTIYMDDKSVIYVLLDELIDTEKLINETNTILNKYADLQLSYQNTEDNEKRSALKVLHYVFNGKNMCVILFNTDGLKEDKRETIFNEFITLIEDKILR